MRPLILTLLVIFLPISLTACGVKGHLKTPEQIERDQAKKAKKAEEKKAQTEDNTVENEEQTGEKK